MLSAQRSDVNHSTSNEKSALKNYAELSRSRTEGGKIWINEALRLSLSLHRDIKVEAGWSKNRLIWVSSEWCGERARGAKERQDASGRWWDRGRDTPPRPSQATSSWFHHRHTRNSAPLIESERGRGSPRFDSCSPLLPPLLLLPPRLRFLENTHNRRVNCEDSGRILVWRGEREGGRGSGFRLWMGQDAYCASSERCVFKGKPNLRARSTFWNDGPFDENTTRRIPFLGDLSRFENISVITANSVYDQHKDLPRLFRVWIYLWKRKYESYQSLSLARVSRRWYNKAADTIGRRARKKWNMWEILGDRRRVCERGYETDWQEIQKGKGRREELSRIPPASPNKPVRAYAIQITATQEKSLRKISWRQENIGFLVMRGSVDLLTVKTASQYRVTLAIKENCRSIVSDPLLQA